MGYVGNLKYSGFHLPFQSEWEKSIFHSPKLRPSAVAPLALTLHLSNFLGLYGSCMCNY